MRCLKRFVPHNGKRIKIKMGITLFCWANVARGLRLTPRLFRPLVVPVKLLTADITVLAENSWNIWLHKREALRLRQVLSAKITITLNKMKMNKCSSHFPDTSMWNTQCNSVCLMLSDWLGSIGAPAVPGAVSLPHRYSARIQQPAKYTQQSSHSQLDGHHS